jgi:hypothetical protein
MALAPRLLGKAQLAAVFQYYVGTVDYLRYIGYRSARRFGSWLYTRFQLIIINYYCGQLTELCNLEDKFLRTHRRENLKPQIV